MTKKTKTILKRVGLSFAGIIIVLAGAAGGFLLGQETFKQVRDYSKYKIDDEDFSEVYNRYEKMSPSKYYSSFSDVELVNIGLINITKCEHLYSISQGLVKAAGVNQTIRAATIRDGDKYFEENIAASSFVKAANRFYQEGETTSWYKGKYVSLTTGNYTNPTETNYTLDEFAKTWGRTLDDPCIYNITNQTYLSGTMTKDTDGNHVVELDLEPILSVIRYVEQMKMTGGLSTPPIFHSVKLTFVLDENVRIVSFTTNEVYDVHKIIDAKNSKGSLTQKFYYSPREIPSLEEQVNYEEEA